MLYMSEGYIGVHNLAKKGIPPLMLRAPEPLVGARAAYFGDMDSCLIYRSLDKLYIVFNLKHMAESLNMHGYRLLRTLSGIPPVRRSQNITKLRVGVGLGLWGVFATSPITIYCWIHYHYDEEDHVHRVD